MGLDVGMRAAKKAAGAIAGQILDHVHIFAAAIIALAGIALGVLVGEHAPLGLPHGGGNEIFRRDEFQLAHLAVGFENDGLGEFRVLENEFIHRGISFCGKSARARRAKDCGGRFSGRRGQSRRGRSFPALRRQPTHFLKMTLALVPPKPNELHMPYSQATCSVPPAR